MPRHSRRRRSRRPPLMMGGLRLLRHRPDRIWHEGRHIATAYRHSNRDVDRAFSSTSTSPATISTQSTAAGPTRQVSSFRPGHVIASTSFFSEVGENTQMGVHDVRRHRISDTSRTNMYPVRPYRFDEFFEGVQDELAAMFTPDVDM